jgi:hypothetical protein
MILAVICPWNLSRWNHQMARKKPIDDQTFIAAFKQYGSPRAVSQALGLAERNVYTRRANIEKKTGEPLITFAGDRGTLKYDLSFNMVAKLREHEIKNGTVVVASDCHYWPGESTIAHKAFVKVIEALKPNSIVLNGDVFDGARISRHEPLLGTDPPNVKQEIEVCVDRLHEIKNASKNSKTFYTMGNHDVRFYRYLAVNAPEMSEFISLFDYFPGWAMCWRLDINDVVIKHRWHNGVHATYNNTLKSGRSIVTGHLHKLQSTPWTDYNGRRYGVDTGTLADIDGDQFAYTEGNPSPWASGFAVLTFIDGKLITPEFCEVIDGVAYFRGKEI